MEPSTRISLKTRPAVVRTAVAPGPPLRTTISKGTLLPEPSPVIVAVPERVAASPLTAAPVIRPVTYVALTVNCPLPVPVPLAGTRARHSNAPVTTPPASSAWNANVVSTGKKPPALPVPPWTMVVPAPRAIVVDWLLPRADGANQVVTNPSPASKPAAQPLEC